MRTYIANFGRENYEWPNCLERGTISTMDDEEVHHFWLNRDKPGYIDYCMTRHRTARGIAVIKPVASRWFNLLDILIETNGDLWIHRQKDTLWWTISTDQEAVSSLEPGHKPLREGARVYVFHKPCTGWSNKDKHGRPLLWDALHPKARQFLFTESTFQKLSEDNETYARTLIDGEDLSAWHNRPDWKSKESSTGRTAGRSFTAKERSANQMTRNVLSTVSQSNGQETTRRIKNKELHFSDQELEQYVLDLIDAQEGLCALTGIQLQHYGEETDKQLLCSLDRIDSNGHYEPGNLQIVCRFSNFWKSDQDDTEFLRLLALVRSTDI